MEERGLPRRTSLATGTDLGREIGVTTETGLTTGMRGTEVTGVANIVLIEEPVELAELMTRGLMT